MNPAGLMWTQGAALGVALDLLALTNLPWLVWALCGCTVAWWLLLNRAYAKALTGRCRTAERAVNDHRVAAQVLVVVVLSSALAGITSGERTQLNSDALTVGFTAVASFWLVTYWSCLVDWYYVRPRRDGVIGLPPCHAGSEDWVTVTRLWYLHRSIVVVVGALASIVALSAFGFAALPASTQDDPVKAGSLVVAAAGTALALSRLIYGSVSTIGDVATSCCFSAPDIAIGEKLRGDSLPFDGYVRDVALEGVTVVALDENGRPHKAPDGGTQTKRYGLAHVLDNPDVVGEPFRFCPGVCQNVNDDCQWIGPNGSAPGTSPSCRYLVL